jgi:3D (Asp-Asp-Asp) domain-containing protein
MPVVLAPEPVVVEAPAPEWQTFEVTAYTAGYESTGKRPGEEGYGITTSGDPVREGITAACPPSMAFGTRLEIEGVGERVCSDRGGSIKEKRLDIYIAELEEARQFGRKWLNVRIIEEES